MDHVSCTVTATVRIVGNLGGQDVWRGWVKKLRDFGEETSHMKVKCETDEKRGKS
jgi:hypothetical protein